MKKEEQMENQDEIVEQESDMSEVEDAMEMASDEERSEGDSVSEEEIEDTEDTEDTEGLELSGEEVAESVSEDDFEISELSASEPKFNSYTSTATAASLSLMAKIEAIIFASSKCMKALDVFEVLEDESVTVDEIQEQIEILAETYSVRQGGFRLEHVRGHGFQFRTVAEAGCYMERLFASRPRPLSRAALETLSIVAYRQPVSRADIEFIRGVDSGSIVKNLLERALIKCVGRNEAVAGKPMVFGTTDEFLAVFRLNSLSELPPISSFQPPQDMLQSAEDQFEDADSEDDFDEDGDFVGVEGEDDPEVSEGVFAESEDEDFERDAEDDNEEELELDSEEAEEGELVRIEGASLSDEPMDAPQESVVENEENLDEDREIAAEGLDSEISEDPALEH